ncbi:MAG: SsrA-binding protein SmpB [Desulfovibrionales bacterium]|nr:SsrA-binding protein SmpB [Desulfovibrionales bacterium]
MSVKVVCQNKKAAHEYFITERYEAGLVLTGSEVKSLRQGKATLADGYAQVVGGEVLLYNVHISPYSHTHHEEQDPTRTRKVLFHRQEIRRLIGKIQEKGLTLIPTKIYFKNGWVKVELALAKGKKLYDKRESIKRREEEREIAKRYRGRN